MYYKKELRYLFLSQTLINEFYGLLFLYQVSPVLKLLIAIKHVSAIIKHILKVRTVCFV